MKSREVLNKVRALLGVEKFLFAQAKLDNGTVVEAESFTAGNEIFIVTEDQKVPLPVGDYTMEDGKKLVVTEEGKIGEVKSVEAEEKEKEKDMNKHYDDEKKMQEEEVTVEAPEEVVEEVEQIVEAVVEAVAPVIEEVKEEVKELRRKFEEQEDKKIEKEKEEEEKKKENMSRAARRPIKHNPETKRNSNRIKFAQDRKASTLDRVMNTLINNNK
jgi:flagellar biosynthesis GTPase FlhF|tara:strand:- start:5 stop:649 length:645 start_codon:yes stop_codon:yes gene_type:complete